MLLESLKVSFFSAVLCSVIASSSSFAFDLPCCDGLTGKIPANQEAATKLNALRIKKCDSKSAFLKGAIMQGKIKIVDSGACAKGWEDKYVQLNDKRYSKLDAMGESKKAAK